MENTLNFERFTDCFEFILSYHLCKCKKWKLNFYSFEKKKTTKYLSFFPQTNKKKWAKDMRQTINILFHMRMNFYCFTTEPELNVVRIGEYHFSEKLFLLSCVLWVCLPHGIPSAVYLLNASVFKLYLNDKYLITMRKSSNG